MCFAVRVFWLITSYTNTCLLSSRSSWKHRGGPPQPSRRLSSHPAPGKNYEQKTCRNSSWGFCLALVRGNSKTDAVEGDTAHGGSHYLRRLGV